MRELTITDAAAVLGVSPDTIRRAIRRGKLDRYCRGATYHTDAHGRYLITLPDAAALSDGDVDTAAMPVQATAPPVHRQQRARLGSPDSVPMHKLLAEVRRSRDDLAAQVEAQRELLEQQARRLDAADVERSELRRLLLNEQNGHARTRMDLEDAQQKLALFLPPPGGPNTATPPEPLPTPSSLAQTLTRSRTRRLTPLERLRRWWQGW